MKTLTKPYWIATSGHSYTAYYHVVHKECANQRNIMDMCAFCSIDYNSNHNYPLSKEMYEEVLQEIESEYSCIAEEIMEDFGSCCCMPGTNLKVALKSMPKAKLPYFLDLVENLYSDRQAKYLATYKEASDNSTEAR